MIEAVRHAGFYELAMNVFPQDKGLRRAIGEDGLLLTGLIASGLTLGEMSRRYNNLWRDHPKLERLVNLRMGHRLWAEPVWSWAALTFDDVRAAVVRFLEAPGGEAAFDFEGFARPVSIALGEPVSREAARALLAGLERLGPEKISKGILTHHSESVPFFWAYLSPLYQRLQELGLDFEHAGFALAILGYKFGTITEALDVPTGYEGIPWKYWDSSYLDEWYQKLPVQVEYVERIAEALVSGIHPPSATSGPGVAHDIPLAIKLAFAA